MPLVATRKTTSPLGPDEVPPAFTGHATESLSHLYIKPQRAQSPDPNHCHVKDAVVPSPCSVATTGELGAPDPSLPEAFVKTSGGRAIASEPFV